MSPELIRSAELIAHVMPSDADWWIIGSAALALSGLDVEPRDIDVFAASDVIEAARVALGAAAMPSASDRFRSSPYFQVHPEGGIEIDFMGSLKVRSGDGWVGLHIESKRVVSCGRARLFVPCLEDQTRIFRLFGRPKDLARAALVDVHLSEIRRLSAPPQFRPNAP